MTITIETQKEKERKEEARKKFFNMIDKVHERTRDIPLKEVDEAIEEAVQAVRKSKIKTNV